MEGKKMKTKIKVIKINLDNESWLIPLEWFWR
jgi:hypothetical protein